MNSTPTQTATDNARVEVWIGGGSAYGQLFDPDELWYVWIRVRRRVFMSQAGFTDRKNAEAAALEVAADVRGPVK